MEIFGHSQVVLKCSVGSPLELRGEVPERSIGPVLKTGVRLVRTVGSNPTLSAMP